MNAKHEPHTDPYGTTRWADGYGVWHVEFAKMSTERDARDRALLTVVWELTTRGDGLAYTGVRLEQITDTTERWVEVDTRYVEDPITPWYRCSVCGSDAAVITGLSPNQAATASPHAPTQWADCKRCGHRTY